jgi:ABC-type uncharacterized transport system permease subunit
MLIRLEERAEFSRAMIYGSPVIAVVLTLISGIGLFALLGVNPAAAIYSFFISPVSTVDGVAELFVKATPLVLIGVGLSFGFRANIWNIGAEGQLIMGGVVSGGLALAFFEVESVFLLPAMMVAGVLGGMAWAAIPAFLKTRYNTNEILTSLMLVYIGALVLSYLIHGPWKAPGSLNFPESELFHPSAQMPILVAETRLHIGWLLALLVVVTGWILIAKHIIGFQIKVIGMAPMAAGFAGFREKRIVWMTLMIGGGTAGLAGMIEVSGPIGQIVPVISPGYGFTAIIVAFLGRLHPVGVLFAGTLMALTYLGGEAAQIDLNLPNAVTGVFQGMLLFFLLAADVLVKYRIRVGSNAPAAISSEAAE